MLLVYCLVYCVVVQSYWYQRDRSRESTPSLTLKLSKQPLVRLQYCMVKLVTAWRVETFKF